MKTIKNVKGDIQTNKVIEQMEDYKTQQSFLSKKLFEKFHLHLSKISLEKQLNFLAFFAKDQNKNQFKQMASSLQEKSIEIQKYVLVALVVNINQQVAVIIMKDKEWNLNKIKEYLDKDEKLNEISKYFQF